MQQPTKQYNNQSDPINRNTIPPITQDNQPKIQNVVATVDLGQKILELKTIAGKCKNTQYNPKRFPAVIIRKKNPKTTGLVFTSGKMIVIGAKTINDSKLAAQTFAKDIQKALTNQDNKQLFKPEDFQIRNIVASCSMPYGINLQKLNEHDKHKNSSSHDEQFPGLIYRLELSNCKLVALIFYSGKIVFTGAKDEGEIQTAFQYMQSILQEFRREEDSQDNNGNINKNNYNKKN